MQTIAIFGVPRSGTSWLGQIFNSSPSVAYRYQPIFAYSFFDNISENSTLKEINLFHERLLSTDDDFVCQKKNISDNNTPQFHKNEITHLVWKEVRYLNIIENLIKKSSTKVIGIIRHPCGVLKSWMKAPKEFDSEWEIEEEWQYASKKNSSNYEFFGYERWLKASRMFKELQVKYPAQFRTVVYESLLDDLLHQIQYLFDYANIAVTEQTRKFLKESTSKSLSDDPYSVYRCNKNGYEWRNMLPIDIINQVLRDRRFLNLAKHYNWEE